MTPEDRHELAQLDAGDVVALAPDSPAHPLWTVRAADRRFVILSRSSGRDDGEEIYTIADLDLGVRGPCDLTGGGWDLDSPTWAVDLLRALNYELQVNDQLHRGAGPVLLEETAVRVSVRNNVPLALVGPPLH